MWNDLFIVSLALVFGLLLRWAFKTLPREDWQMLAAVPLKKRDSETWSGMNLTYYGVFIAGSAMAATAVAVMLLASVQIPGRVGLLMVVLIFATCLPASSILARIVERRQHTLTIGGASFLGIMLSPLFVWAANLALGDQTGVHIPMVPTLAAFSIAYAIGEGLGRLACISFGCCYGKPLDDSHELIRKVFAKHAFSFEGKTKKIAYEGSLAGTPVVPIQAVTSIVYLAAALTGMGLFMRGSFSYALLVAMVTTQAWRIISELVRADYRGERSWSAYQTFAAVGACFVLMLCFFLPTELPVSPDLYTGASALWDPLTILALQAVFVVTLLATGLSKVTSSTITFHVRGTGS